MTFGEKLQKLRKARGWTQEELAQQAGVSRQSLSQWESDAAMPDTANVIALSDLFGVSTDYLLRGRLVWKNLTCVKQVWHATEERPKLDKEKN